MAKIKKPRRSLEDIIGRVKNKISEIANFKIEFIKRAINGLDMELGVKIENSNELLQEYQNKINNYQHYVLAVGIHRHYHATGTQYTNQITLSLRDAINLNFAPAGARYTYEITAINVDKHVTTDLTESIFSNYEEISGDLTYAKMIEYRKVHHHDRYYTLGNESQIIALVSKVYNLIIDVQHPKPIEDKEFFERLKSFDEFK